MSSPSAKTPAKHVDPNRALRMARNIEYPKEVWYFVAGVIFVLCLWNIVSFLGSIQWKSPRSTAEGSDKVCDESSGRKNRTPQASNTISLRRIPLAVASVFKNIVFRSTIRLSSDMTVNLAEIVIITGYCAALLAWEFINTRNVTTHKNLDIPYWANRAGTLAASQTTLIVALAGRNNIISLLTGISYERLNIVHRGVARAVLLMSWIHAGGKLKAGVTDWNQTWLRSGFVSLIAYTLLLFISIRPIRKVAYEFFCYSHLVLVIFMLFGAYFHMQQVVGLGYYVWPALLVWAIERVLRLARLLVYNFPHYPPVSPSTVELLSADTVRLTVRRRRVTWRPGQSMFLTLPEISRLPFESHPFTISSLSSTPAKGGIQGEKELVFIIRARGGVTERLRDMARDVPHKSLNVIIDGPYGSPPSLTSFSTVVLFAGGSGVSYCIPMFTDLVRRAREGRALCRRIVFVWSVRDLKHMQWISASLSQILSEVPSHLEVDVRIQVTGPSTSDMFTSENTSGTPASSSNEKLSCGNSMVDAHSHTTSDDFTLKKPRISGSHEELSCGGSSILESHGETTSDNISELYKLSAVTIGKGRADVGRILDEEISCACGAVSVDVCGPHRLVEAVRSALRSDIAGPIGVLKGRASVTLHVQKFGLA